MIPPKLGSIVWVLLGQNSVRSTLGGGVKNRDFTQKTNKNGQFSNNFTGTHGLMTCKIFIERFVQLKAYRMRPNLSLWH